MLTELKAPIQPALAFVREGFATFTPAQANTVITWCRYDLQRDEMRAKSHIAILAEYMRRGQWLAKSQLDFARLNGRLILINGHHRMRAQIEAGKDILWSVVIHNCTSDAEVRGLYHRFDTNLRKRTAANIMQGVGFTDQSGLAKETSAALWNSAPLIAQGMIFRRYQDGAARDLLTDERLEVCQEYAPYALAMQDYIRLAPKALRIKMKNVSCFALAMVTLKHQPEIATAFWRGMCEDDGLPKGDPRKTLLFDMQNRTSRGSLLAAQLMASAKAWNAFFEGRELKIIKVTGSAIPIAGTPYTVRA